jgi:ArsR family transcriptional regulator
MGRSPFRARPGGLMMEPMEARVERMTGTDTLECIVDGRACCSPVAGGELTREQAGRLARMLKVLAEPSRLRLISTMVSRPGQAACGCELTEPLGLSQPTISYHMGVLLRAGLIEPEAAHVPDDGCHPGPRCVYYRVVPETLSAVAGALTPSSST